MPTTFQSLSELLEKVEATKKRLEITALTANYLKKLSVGELEPAVNMMVGRAFPKYSQKSLDVSWATVARMLGKVAVFDSAVFRQAMAKTGDVGRAAKLVLEGSKAKKQTLLIEQPLTILEVKRTLDAIAETSGSGARQRKERLIAALLSQASPLEAKYLVKLFVGEMRTGLHEGLMEQSVADAFGVPLLKVQHASMVVGDIGEVVAILKSQGAAALETLGFQVFHPVQLMLAQTADSVDEALAEQGCDSAFEYKYDGARIQIHKKKSYVEIFSRRLTEVTDSLPEIVRLVKQNVAAESAILEGEVIALDAAGFPIAFQHVMRRFKRVYGVSGMVQRIPLSLYLFDILYLNGESVIALPYVKRRKLLAENAGEIPLTTHKVTRQASEASSFLCEAIQGGHEGLMAKKLDSPYTPGRRGKRWLKIKTVLEPLDLVISAAEYGYGRRKGWLSDYYLAARHAETGEFLDVGKTFKGLTDVEIIALTDQLKQSAVRTEHNRVVVLPKIVVEVAYNEIQRSPKYKSQMALRFARISKIRDDKTPQEADTIQRVKEIYERQFSKKGKYKAD